jgi:hypothetical protein
MTTYDGTAPSVFIGSYGYPRVRGGPLLTHEPDNPLDWIGRGLGIGDIIGMRARTIRGTMDQGRLWEGVEEIAMASSPPRVEASFSRPVSFALVFDGTIAPIALSGALDSLSVTEPAKVSRPVEQATGDTDLTATEACGTLYNEGVDTHQITTLLSAGLLGVRRRVVPTRWSITAVDDILGSRLKRATVKFAGTDKIEVFTAELYGNRVACILTPGPWRFEMVEVWKSKSLWGQGRGDTVVADHEGLKKTGYSPIAGGYYAGRLGVTEYLTSQQRSARSVLVRVVTGDYWAPLGVWVVREVVRAAFRNPPVQCSSIPAACSVASTYLGYPAWEQHSTLLKEIRVQRTLKDFF